MLTRDGRLERKENGDTSRHTHVLRSTVGRWSRQGGRDGGDPEKARAGFIGMCT